MIVRHLPLIRGAKMNQGAKMNCCDRFFFDGNGETYMKCWEAQNLLKSMFCCDMSNFFDGNGETYMKCWEAQNLLKSMFCCDMSNFFLTEMLKLTWNAKKHKIGWKTCFVVTCLFFWWKWRNLHEMLRSRSCWEAKNISWKACFVVTCLKFFWRKKLKLLMLDWGTFKKHPNWN